MLCKSEGRIAAARVGNPRPHLPRTAGRTSAGAGTTADQVCPLWMDAARRNGTVIRFPLAGKHFR